jgi:uncharacterized protein YidB (DUF937 family)
MRTERNLGGSKVSRSEFQRVAARSGVMVGGAVQMVRSAISGDKVTMWVSALTSLAASLPVMKEVGEVVINDVRKKVGVNKA